MANNIERIERSYNNEFYDEEDMDGRKKFKRNDRRNQRNRKQNDRNSVLDNNFKTTW